MQIIVDHDLEGSFGTLTLMIFPTLLMMPKSCGFFHYIVKSLIEFFFVTRHGFVEVIHCICWIPLMFKGLYFAMHL
jgi:hypothetical protein